MITRCISPKDHSYPHYGGRGIKVCERWKAFVNFLADMGEIPDGMTLDRKDTNGDYCPENCRWATQKEQQRNRRSNVIIVINGEAHCVAEWCEIRGLSRYAVYQRLDHGWTPEEVLEFVPRKRPPHYTRRSKEQESVKSTL